VVKWSSRSITLPLRQLGFLVLNKIAYYNISESTALCSPLSISFLVFSTYSSCYGLCGYVTLSKAVCCLQCLMSIYSHVIIIFFDDLSATHRAVSSAVQRRRVTVTVCDLNSTVSVNGQVTHTKCAHEVRLGDTSTVTWWRQAADVSMHALHGEASRSTSQSLSIWSTDLAYHRLTYFMTHFRRPISSRAYFVYNAYGS